MARRLALSRWLGGGGGNPSTVSAPDELLPDNGSTLTAAAPVTPGMLAMSDTALATKTRRASSVEYFHSGRYAGAVTTLVGSKPGSTWRRLRKLVSSRPAPTSRVSARAISAVAKAASARVRDFELPPRPSCLREAPTSDRAACIAGA